MRVAKVRPSGPVCDFDRTVTPMVDVVFQLLVFFVLASSGRVAERTLSTTLSAGAVGSTVPLTTPAIERVPELWLHLRRDTPDTHTEVRINDGPTGDAGLLPQASLRQGDRRSKQRDPRRAGKNPLGDVIAVYDACRAAKFHAINFAAAPNELH